LRWAAVVLSGGLVSSCALSNVAVDACPSDAACADAFGLGSLCVDGYCSEPSACTTGHDCRRAHGGGACVEGVCKARLPADPLGACNSYEPSDLPSRALAQDGAPVLIGGMFLFESDFSPPIADAARLAVREINSVGGVGNARPLGMVLCDNGGTSNSLSGDERTRRIQGVVDYLGTTLGVPYTVGPLTSGDSLFAIQRAVARKLPMVFVSPSATSPALTGEPDRLFSSDYGLFWRTAPSDQLQGAVLARHVAGVYPTPDPALGKVAVAYRDDAYGVGLADAFQKEFEGETALIKFAIDADLTAVAASVLGTGPDGVMFVDIGGDRAVGFVTGLVQHGLGPRPVFLADGSKNQAMLDPNLPSDVKDIIYGQTVGTVAAAPAGPDFKLFQSSYSAEFGSDPANSAFTANGYDAAYVGAAGVVFASQDGDNYDGRHVAKGLSRLISGADIHLSGVQWGALKSGLTSGNKEVDITGVSGALDFDVESGEASAPIEIWRPSRSAADCNNQPPCFKRLTVVTP
jgi:ABC-type branched-subunit amino acid transport system substrate-binding protein